MTDIFDAMIEEGVKNDPVDLALLSRLIQEVSLVDGRLLELSKDVKELTKQREVLVRESIPEAMAGLREVKTNDGRAITVKPKIHVSLKKAGVNRFYRWLEVTKQDSIIKRFVTVSPKESFEFNNFLKKVRDALGSEYAEVAITESIHSATLKSFVKRLREGGVEFPEDCLSIFEYQEAHIK